ncbi:MAG TPA: hypothetical protein PLC42_00410, partial [Parachlamydiaceae bacterium]|nr:hypothetical protein [Parachlamydiaceae bacterium]
NRSADQTYKNRFMQALAADNELALKTPANSFCESKDVCLKRYIKCALDELEMLKTRVKSAPVKSELTHKINYLKLIHQCEEGSIADINAIFRDLRIIANAELSLPIQTIALIYFIFMKIKYQNAIITNPQAVLLLKTICSNEGKIPGWITAQALYMLAILRTEHQNDSMTDHEAILNFQSVSQNNAASPIVRAMADFKIVEMISANRAPYTIDHMVNLLKFIQISTIPDELQQDGNYLLAEMQVKYQHNLIDDKQAFIIFKNFYKNPQFPLTMRIKAALYMTMLRLQNRTELINDKKTIKILLKICLFPEAPQPLRDKAEYQIAKMWLQQRADDRIQNAFVAEIFLNRSKNNRLSPALRDEAWYNLGQMCFNKLSNLMTDKEVVELFYKFSQHIQTPDFIYKESLNYIAQMVIQERSNFLTIEKANEILIKTK